VPVDVREILQTGAPEVRPLDFAAVTRRQRTLRRRGVLLTVATVAIVGAIGAGAFALVEGVGSGRRVSVVSPAAGTAAVPPIGATPSSGTPQIVYRTLDGTGCTTTFGISGPIAQGCAAPFPAGSPRGTLAWSTGGHGARVSLAGVTDPGVASVEVTTVENHAVLRLLTFTEPQFPHVRFFSASVPARPPIVLPRVPTPTPSDTTLLALDAHGRLLRTYHLGPALADIVPSGASPPTGAAASGTASLPAFVPSAPREWSTLRDPLHGVSIAYPRSWRPARSTLTPVLVDPTVPLALGTYPLEPQRLGECDIVPQRALEALGPRDAFLAIYVFDGLATGDFSARRPARFGPQLPWFDHGSQCTEHVPGRVGSITFTDHGHRLSVLIAYGAQVGRRRLGELYRILDTLTVTPAG
jgi:hypothetical protein